MARRLVDDWDRALYVATLRRTVETAGPWPKAGGVPTATAETLDYWTG